MNKTIILIMTLFGFLSFAGVGGYTGGTSSVLVDEIVCMPHPETSQIVCQKVTYYKRPESKPEPVKCEFMVGESGTPQPCPTVFGLPGWLRK